MIFESLWPLFFLAAVPIIIILYLLKPKGEDLEISSNLLWQKLLKNQQSKTFFEKFVHNILMYLQILIVVLLVVALMSPFITTSGKAGSRKILLIDTSGSMQHVDKQGKSRLDRAIEQACDYVRTMKNDRFSVVVADGSEVSLLAVDSTDTFGLMNTLQGLKAGDGGDNLLSAQGVLDTLAGDTKENAAELIVYTDGNGASCFESFQNMVQKELHVVGEPTSNVANEYTVFTLREDGLYDVIVSLVNYSDDEVTCDVGVYEGEKTLLALKQVQMEASGSANCLFEGVSWQGEIFTSEVTGIQFKGGQKDSLSADNVSHAVKTKGDLINGLLIGDGNTFIEKAYQAVVGKSLAKSTSTDSIENSAYNVVIYDNSHVAEPGNINRLMFGKGSVDTAGVLDNIMLEIRESELTAGLSEFKIGVNKAYYFELPEGAQSFLEYEGKTVGYYMEKDGYREVTVGFDIRESDFPLKAEFPIFLANAMIYLSDTSWLTTNVYYAGEKLALQSWAKSEDVQGPMILKNAGVYEIENEGYSEFYVVRFQSISESDGRKVAESITVSGELQVQKVRQTLRNLFLLVALLFLVVEWIIYVRQMRYKGKFYLAIRGLVLLCLILALAGLQIRVGNGRNATIFVVDLSNSNVENLETTKKYLGETISKMPGGNSYGIITFGKNTLVEQFITSEKTYGGLLTLPDKEATNFEEALSKAISMIPENTNGRLVLITDGKETKGDIQRMGQAITASQTELLTLLFEDIETTDAYIENVTLPSYLHPGDKYHINVMIESNYDTEAVLTLYDGSAELASNSVHLNKGSNHFVFNEQVALDKEANAMETIAVKLTAEGDSCEDNNRYSAFSVVEATPRVLVIADRKTDVSGFRELLKTAGSEYTEVSPLNAPDSLQAMLEYKSIILVDTYIDELPLGFLDNLEVYVKDYGCGFVCCGGEDSFALGGYRDTVIETVLPVKMELHGVNELPTMAMVMVIDHSGSMMTDASNGGSTNLDVAIKATNVAIDNLRNTDYVGVLTFDDSYTWQVEPTLADKKNDIKNKVKKISAGGGTTIKPALREAYRAISDCEATTKHVVLLTDGMGETKDYSDIVNAFAREGITLSTVAVGDGSDVELLEQLAEDCGGRYYYTDLSSDIPKIFAQEVFLGGDSFIQNGSFQLNVRTGHELTRNLFQEGWPVLYGYVASSLKTASSSIITSEGKEDPILTTWQYGLGRTVAWNSDVTGEWSGAYVGNDDYVQLWKRIIDYSTGNADIGEDRVDVVTAGEITEVVYEAKDYDAGTEIFTTIIDPDGNKSNVKLTATAPGKFKTEIPTDLTGIYHFNVRREKDGNIQSYLTTATTVQFSDEYKFDVGTERYLKFAEQYGRLITRDENIWKNPVKNTKGSRPITNYLIALSIFLFLADVAMRRFQYVPNWKGFKKAEMRAEDLAHSESSKTEKQQEAVVENMSEERKGQKQPKAREKKKKKEETMLDTSQLLKKKDDRNI